MIKITGTESLKEKIEKKVFNNREGILSFLLILLVITMIIFSGLYRLEKKSAVDEQLWTFGRIQKFWNNIADGELEKTIVSDKPGITVAILSGIGMKISNPLDQKSSFWKNETSNPQKIAAFEKINFVFRLPILLFFALSIIPFFLFTKKLFGLAVARFSIIAIGLSPLLLGISTIVNPDSILWIFSTLSFLSLLIYLKDDNRKYIYLSGIFLGLSILTKYVANIFYVFFPLIVFLEYFLFKEKYSSSWSLDLRKKWKDLAILFLFSFMIILFFLPALWKQPWRILELTFFSQVFQKIWIPYLTAFLVITCDIFIFKGKMLSFLGKFLTSIKRYLPPIIFCLFIVLSVLTFINVYSGMHFFEFESILASPKTAYHDHGSLDMLSANFYSLLFGISPLLLFFMFFILIKNIFYQNSRTANIFFFILFILIYYGASIFSNVGATIRYQIMIIPIALIISSIGIGDFLSKCKIRFIVPIITIILFATLLASLLSIKPFYFGYASEILPKKDVLNPKDMGEGSYEAASFLNSLPEAKKLTIWSDKDGVCDFFIGKCYNDRDPEKPDDFDYFVVSFGRKSAITRLISQRIENGKKYPFRIDKFYEMSNPDWKLEIANRPNNYIKIFSRQKLYAE